MTRNTEQPAAPAPRIQLSAQTLFRMLALDPKAEEALHAIYASKNHDESSTVELQALVNIGKAQNPVQLISLTTQSFGVAQQAWYKRMATFGAEALPPMTRRLKSSQSIANVQERHLIVERILVALYKMGEPGAQAILDCFNNLDVYCQSLAAVALGKLNYQPATDTVWSFFQRVKGEADLGAITGALWGLADLQHPQADQALADVMNAGAQFTEQYNLVARAGGPACVKALAHRLNRALQDEADERERYEILFALTAIGHRLGQEQYQALLSDIVEPEESVSAIVELMHKHSAQEVAAHFDF
jgi:hypothetical protein